MDPPTTSTTGTFPSRSFSAVAPRVATWVAVALALTAAWSSAGISPLREAVTGALAPSDFATDFVPAARLGRQAADAAGVVGAGPIDVAAGNAAATRLGAPRYANVGVPFGAHPPPAVLLVATLVPLGFGGAALAWLALSLGALALVAWVASAALVRDGDSRRALLAVGLFMALTFWPPVLHNIEKGQWSALLAGLLAGAWWAHTRRRHRLTGALIALAASFKVMPLLVLMAFAGSPPARRRAVLMGAATTLVVVLGASTILMGPQPWLDFLRAAPLNTEGWQTAPANTLSLWGLVARLLVGGPFAEPLATVAGHGESAKIVGRLAWAAAAVTLLALAIRRLTLARDRGPPATVPHPSTPTAAERGYAAWCALAVVLGPLSWSHTAIVLVLPLALLVGRGAAERLAGLHPPPRSFGRGGRCASLAAAVTLLTIPRLTLFAWAGALPVRPGAGLLLSLHLAAALILFFVAVFWARATSDNPHHPGGVA